MVGLANNDATKILEKPFRMNRDYKLGSASEFLNERGFTFQTTTTCKFCAEYILLKDKLQ